MGLPLKLGHAQRTKQGFLAPLKVSQKFSSCVTGAAKYALDRGKGLILQIAGRKWS